MRALLRDALAVVLATSLVNLPCAAATNSMLGVVGQSHDATDNGAAAPPGTTVFAGDAFQTAEHGEITLLIEGTALSVPGSSGIQFEEDTSHPVACLNSGALDFRFPPDRRIEVRALGVLIAASADDEVKAQVRISGPTEFILNALSGPLLLQYDGKAYPINPGHMYRVDLQDQPVDTTVHPARSRKGLAIFILGAAAAGLTGLYLYHEATESPFKP
jgi:hypothetical protein